MRYAVPVTLNMGLRDFSEAIRQLEHLEYKILNIETIIRPKVEEGARQIALSAQNKAPKRTGYMASQIMAEGSIVIGRATYTSYVEKGHHTRGGGRWIAGQFFMKQAVEENLPSIRDRIAERIREELTRP